ncbi:alpha-L-rhamnosidase C-terminal domain-containing protein [Streptomyces sp. NBC_01003]|uniref:alpha-L-rhamnosidase C-terminal domain-containing protein n=1 Tax=Streptomyces sp. NBC_01003 TaxID=2903714 RepID=UPI00386FCDCB
MTRLVRSGGEWRRDVGRGVHLCQVTSEWRRLYGRIGMGVTVPCNTEAEMWVPAQRKRGRASQGVAYVRDDASGSAQCRLCRATMRVFHCNAASGYGSWARPQPARTGTPRGPYEVRRLSQGRVAGGPS